MFGGMRKTTVAGWSVGSAYASLKSEGRSPWRFRQGWCAFAFAILTAGAVTVPASTGAYAQALNCSNLTSAAPIAPTLRWTIAAGCSAVSTATGATTALTTMDIAFLTQTSAFVGAPSNAQPNQMGSGIWIRGVGGQNTVSSTGTATVAQVPGLSLTANSQGRMDFGGFQVGADLGRFNLGATGLNVVFGVTGGLLDATDHELIGTGTFAYSIPFVGGYAATTWGNFFADVTVREDFYSETVTAANVGLSGAGVSGNSVNVMGEAGYRFDIGRWFVEPSAGLVWSRLDTGSLAVVVPSGLAAPLPATVPGTFGVNPIDSLIGRAGVRVGTSVQAGNIGLQPFVAASVWNEFASNATSSGTFLCPCTAPPSPVTLNISDTRVGTFGQFGVGTAAQILNTGWLGFVRADYRTGENIQGWDLTGGIRYQFLWDNRAPLITK